MLRVLIVDDHTIVRRGLVHILKSELGLGTVLEADCADDAVALVRSNELDLVILDITMPGRSGLDALADIKALRPGLPVLMLSMHPEDQMAVRVLRAGASGFLCKDSAPEELVKAVRKVTGGGRYASPTLAEQLVVSLQTEREEQPHEALSNREFEVLKMLASGKTITRISADLHLSVKTVSTYHRRILEKLDMQSDSELIRYAIRQNLVY